MKNVLKVLITIMLIVFMALLTYCAMVEPRLSFVLSGASRSAVYMAFLVSLLVKLAALIMMLGTTSLINYVWTGKKLVLK